MATVTQTKPVKISFDDPEKHDEFVNWVEKGQKDNSIEMRNMRSDLDRIRQRRKAMVNVNAKRRNKS